MATKSSKVSGSFPSVSDLLDKPPIRALADRWNRSVVAAGVRSFLDDLRSDLSRRGTESTWPSLRELVERASRHIVALQQATERPAINATGRIWGAPWIGRPMCEAGIERAFAAGRDFLVSSPPSSLATSLAGDVAPLLCRITGAPAAVAVHSYSGALWLTLSAVAADKEVIVSRAELGSVSPGCSLAELFAFSGAAVREVGTTNRTAAAQYEVAVSSQTAAVLKCSPDGFCVVGDTEEAELEELVGLTRDRELVLIDALGAAPLVDLPSASDQADGGKSVAFGEESSLRRRSVRASLVAGADLVIALGDGLVGGPACGILAGRREIIRRITEHPLFAAWQLDAPRSAALAATLQCCEDDTRSEFTVPLLQLLSTPLENLRNRAERLAPQLAPADGVGAAEPVATQSHVDPVSTSERAIASFGVALTAADGDLDALERRLGFAPLPVCGRVEGDRLVLDLRTVFPRQDQAIVEALLGRGNQDESTCDSQRT